MAKVMITGHRPERLGDKAEAVRKWIEETLQGIDNIEACISGMAKGVDYTFATVAMVKGLPLIAAFPYRHKLSEPEQICHDYAKEVHWETETWYKSCYLDRDRWMVDHADIVLVVWDGQPGGGAYYTMKYAQQQGKQIILFPWDKE